MLTEFSRDLGIILDKYNQTVIQVNQLNNKCKTHFEEDNFNTYCITCGENACNINRWFIAKS